MNYIGESREYLVSEAQNEPAVQMIFNGSRAALINSHLEPLRHPVGEADGELLHLGHLQPLLLCLELCAGFHHHLEQKKETLQNKHARIHRSETKSQSQRRKQTDSAFNHKNGADIKRGRHPVLVSDHLFTFLFPLLGLLILAFPLLMYLLYLYV